MLKLIAFRRASQDGTTYINAKTVWTLLVLGALASLSASSIAQSTATAALRVTCEGKALDADININGKFKGTCPVDISIAEGELLVRATKADGAMSEYVFEQRLRIAAGTVKRLEIVFSTPQLTARGKELQALAAAKLEAERIEEEKKLARAAAKVEAERIEAETQRKLVVDSELNKLKSKGAEAGNGAAFKDCDVCPDMVMVPPGRPVPRPPGNVANWHNKVRFSAPFAVGKFEVTYDDWAHCVKDSACSPSIQGADDSTTGVISKSPKTDYSEAGRQPVVFFRDVEVKIYINWLSAKSGYDYRLLSLAEAIYVARAGKDTHFPWGNSIQPGAANCLNCWPGIPPERAVLVGSFAPNAWGIHDMVGNVREMVADCVILPSNWNEMPTDGRPAPAKLCAPSDARADDGPLRYVYGGGWIDSLDSGIPLQMYFRDVGSPNIGFRVARNLLPRQ